MVKTELQNKVWAILPKEFKEEVNEIYANAIDHCGRVGSSPTGGTN